MVVGNDVVDLLVASREHHWRRKGFLQKVFWEQELEFIDHGEQDTRVWLLWSMKEAAYKARQRVFQLPPILNWKSFHCHIPTPLKDQITGTVHIEGSCYFTSSEIRNGIIHTVACAQEQVSLRKVVYRGSSSQVKHLLLQEIAPLFRLETERLRIGKNLYGVPSVFHKNTEIFTQFSLSDHGRFAAFSRQLINS